MKALLSRWRNQLREQWARLREWLVTYDWEERYCVACGKCTVHSKKGCLDCDFMERAW